MIPQPISVILLQWATLIIGGFLAGWIMGNALICPRHRNDRIMGILALGYVAGLVALIIGNTWYIWTILFR